MENQTTASRCAAEFIGDLVENFGMTPEEIAEDAETPPEKAAWYMRWPDSVVRNWASLPLDARLALLLVAEEVDASYDPYEGMGEDI